MKVTKTSGLFRLDSQDLIKGLVVTVVSVPLMALIQSLNEGSISFDYKKTLMAGLAAGLSYLLKNFLTPSQTIVEEDVNTSSLEVSEQNKPI